LLFAAFALSTVLSAPRVNYEPGHFMAEEGDLDEDSLHFVQSDFVARPVVELRCFGDSCPAMA